MPATITMPEPRTIAIRSLSTGAAVLKLHGIVAAGQPGLQVYRSRSERAVRARTGCGGKQDEE